MVTHWWGVSCPLRDVLGACCCSFPLNVFEKFALVRELLCRHLFLRQLGSSKAQLCWDHPSCHLRLPWPGSLCSRCPAQPSARQPISEKSHCVASAERLPHWGLCWPVPSRSWARAALAPAASEPQGCWGDAGQRGQLRACGALTGGWTRGSSARPCPEPWPPQVGMSLQLLNIHLSLGCKAGQSQAQLPAVLLAEAGAASLLQH